MLTDVNFESVTTIIGDLGLTFHDVPLLNNVNFNSLQTVNQLTVFNTGLTNLGFLCNLSSITTDLDIENNNNLSGCAIQAVCDHLNNSGTLTISNNATGCNTAAEVTAVCNNTAPVESMSCSDVNISLNENCQVLVTPDMMLTGGSYSCLDVNYTVMVFTDEEMTNMIPTSPIVGAAYEGFTLYTKVTHTETGNSCWGKILVEDKMGPAFDCPTDPIEIDCTDELPPALEVSQDNCGTATVTMESVSEEMPCESPYTEKITRTFTATDGNNSTTCEQVILVKKVFDPVKVPKKMTFDCAFDLEAVWQDEDPDAEWYLNGAVAYLGMSEEHFMAMPAPPVAGQLVSGEPTGGACANLIISKSDQVQEVCGGPGGTRKIIRTWTITDWCAGTSINKVQIIKLEDTTGPTFDQPDDITIGTSSNGCAANITLPTITTDDDCSTVNDPVFSIDGVVVSGQASNLPKGMTTIDFSITDGCDNETTGSFKVTVVDNTAPIAICDQNTVASIGSVDGIVSVPASAFNSGSYDNCGEIWMKVKRMDLGSCNGANENFTGTYIDSNGDEITYTEERFDDQVTFCCEDDTEMVRFMVFDVDPGAGPVTPSRIRAVKFFF